MVEDGEIKNTQKFVTSLMGDPLNLLQVKRSMNSWFLINFIVCLNIKKFN